MSSYSIVIVGFGAMGKMAAQLAEDKGHRILRRIDPKAPEAELRCLDHEALKGADLVIDFSVPSAVLDNIRVYCSAKVDAIVGTTAWYSQLQDVKLLVQQAGTRFLWSSNFSVGVNLYYYLVEVAARAFSNFKEYDVWGHELHHRNKVDSPSGTAKNLSEIILRNMPRKKRAVFDRVEGKLADDDFHFSSLRGGALNFEHTLAFDSEADCLSIKHAARNRSGYAAGVIRAAEWLKKKEPGFYGFEDFMQELIK